MQAAVHTFLLAFPALFSIVNPPGAAFIFREVTSASSHAGRVRIARRVALYALMVMLAALWLGSYILQLFGLTIAALRIAGGLVVCASAWELLRAPEAQHSRKQDQASAGEGSADIAFFPLTLPITIGPGTISVAIALSANRPAGTPPLWFALGATAAAAAMAVVIWVTFLFADAIVDRLGPTGSRTATRLFAFLLLCIGVQILISGVEEVAAPLLARVR